MKILIKIEEYLPETQQIVVKFCSSQSEKSIDDVQSLVIDLDKLELFDTELFLESLTAHGQEVVKRYKQLQFGEDIENGPLDISKLVGRTIERQEFPRNKKMIPMRRVEL
tara:strand:- start:2025 stop:2354 length:330 start_codon:yes stop_codon:yes gene_type:complete